ncbi:MAG: hypothetical protein ACLU0O_08225 [Collinsella sp.]
MPRAIARTRRRSTALLWVLTIKASVRVPLLAAFAAVAVTVYICIWVLALCVWIVAAALGGVGVVGLLLAVSGVTIGHFPYALASAGVGLGLVGVALFVGAGAWAASKQIARLSALWARKPPRPSGRVRARRKRRCRRISRRGKRVSTMTSAKKIYRRGGWAAAGVVLAGIGFIASGFDPAVFTTQIDTRDSTIVLGGVDVDEYESIPFISQLANLGEIDTSTSRIPPRPQAQRARALCPPSCVSRRNPNLNPAQLAPSLRRFARRRAGRDACPKSTRRKGTRRLAATPFRLHGATQDRKRLGRAVGLCLDWLH